MRKSCQIIAAFLFAVPLLLWAGEDQKTAPPAAGVIPLEAKEIAANQYRYTDPQGKTWMFLRTPFGVMRMEQAAERATPDPAAALRVTEQGDSVRIEQPSPFGRFSWVKKKTALTEVERRAWERERARNAQPAEAPAAPETGATAQANAWE